MTGTHASQEAEATVQTPLIQGILKDLAAVDLSAVQLPSDGICKHFVAIGNADNHMKRLVVLRANIRKEISSVALTLIKDLASVMFKSSEGESDVVYDSLLKSAKDLGKKEKLARRRLLVLGAMLDDAFEQSFPQHADKTLLVDSLGSVGFINHRHEQMATEADAVFREMLKAGHLSDIGLPPGMLDDLLSGNFDLSSLGSGMFSVNRRPPRH